jgi:UDP-N-acetyl-D-mannosaminuronate dehydrogenase
VLTVLGLGYVGLPLAVSFGQNRLVIGFSTRCIEHRTNDGDNA